MKLFTVKVTPTVIDQLKQSDEHYTRHLCFDREYVLIYTKKIDHYIRPDHVPLYSVKDSHKPQGTIISEEQFLALFMIPEETRIAFLIECQAELKREKAKGVLRTLL